MHIIAGRYRGQRLVTPRGPQTRPTSNRLREALFNICQHTIEEACFLDVFAGSGAIGFEALSRGAQKVAFIDSHKESIHCLSTNAAHLKVEQQTQILRGEALTMLKMLERRGQLFDLIYVDPPYKTLAPGSELFYSAWILQWIDAHEILCPGGLLFIEEDARAAPKTDHLETLVLIDSRRFGQAALQQYQKSKDEP